MSSNKIYQKTQKLKADKCNSIINQSTSINQQKWQKSHPHQSTDINIHNEIHENDTSSSKNNNTSSSLITCISSAIRYPFFFLVIPISHSSKNNNENHNSFSHQTNYDWFIEPSAVSVLLFHLNLGMHGLIFNTSIWLLAGSTRYLFFIFFLFLF